MVGQPLGDAGPGQEGALGVVVEFVGDQAVEQLLGRRVGGHLQGGELRVLVIWIVPAGLVELDPADVGRVDGLIPAPDELVLDEGLEDAADDGPLGHPEDQSRPDELRDGEQVQLASQPAMVALLRFLHLGDVGLQVLLVEERGAVDALEHVAVGLSLPVGAGDREQLERPDLAGVGDVRPSAEVDELPLPVEAEHAVLVQLVVDVLDLERLAQVGDELAGLGRRQAEPLERLGILGDAGHLDLDGREVVLREIPAGNDDVIVEPVGGRRPERQPDAREQPHDGAGHDVGGRMPQDVERLAVLRGEDLQVDGRLVTILERPVEVNDPPLGGRRDRRVGQPLADPLGDLPRGDPVVILLDRPIRQSHPNHRRRLPAH